MRIGKSSCATVVCKRCWFDDGKRHQQFAQSFVCSGTSGSCENKTKNRTFGTSGRICFPTPDRKSTRLNSSHVRISYAVFCLKKKIQHQPKLRPSTLC